MKLASLLAALVGLSVGLAGFSLEGLAKIQAADAPSGDRRTYRDELLWQEYRDQHPNGYGYSRFCDLYRAFAKRISPTMRQHHIAGERMFVDYAGTTMEVIDGLTGEVLNAQLFVAVLGASSYTWASYALGLGQKARFSCALICKYRWRIMSIANSRSE